MLQSKTRFALLSDNSAVHFGALLKTLRHRQGVRQGQVLAHLPGWTQTTYSRVETGEIAPAFDQLAPIYAALLLAGVELTPVDRQQFLTLARMRIEAKKTYQEHRTDREWDELRLRLSRTDQGRSAYGQAASGQRSVTTSPRLVETRHLVGREDWLASVMASLQEALPKKLIVLQGPVGIGKSSELHRLALHMLSAASSPFQVCLCELAAAEQEADPESALDLLLGTLLAELGSPDASLSLPSLEMRVTYTLHGLEKASRPVLLFIDNGERLLEEEGRFAPCWERFLQRFLRSQHRSTLVLATREWPGWFEGERTFVVERIVPPLSSEAGALLLQQLGLADVPGEFLRQASETVGGVPLCLEWLASLVQEPMWLDEWQESDDQDAQEEEGAVEQTSTRCLLRLLDDASLFGGPIATKLHPLLERIIEKRLSPEAYQVLCTLALANVPLSKPALPVICPRPRLLKELSATSLLVAYPQRVQVLPMVASAVRARLSAEQQDQIEERLFEAYHHWLVYGKTSLREMGAIIGEIALLSLKHHRFLEAAELLIRHGWLSFNLGLAPRLARFAQNVMQHVDWHTTEENTCGGILLNFHLSPFLGKAADAGKCFADFQHLQAAVLQGKLVLRPPTVVYLTHHMMNHEMNRGHFEAARTLLEDCCTHLESLQTDDLDLRASLLEKRAMLFGAWSEYLDEQGETQEARALRKQSIEAYKQCVDLLSREVKGPPLTLIRIKKRLGLCLNRLSDELNRSGEPEQALVYAERGIEVKEHGYVEVGALAASYGEKAEILMELGRFQEALRFDEKALAEVQRFADAGHTLSQEEMWVYRVNRGRLFLRLGRVDEAERLLQEALPHIHPRRRLYQMFAEEALEEIHQWRHAATSSLYQLDWRWVERYRELDAFDAYWWWAQAGPFNDEEQRRWEELYRPAPDEATKEALGGIVARSRRRELLAALSEHREPHLWYPALEIAEVQRRIAGMLQLEADIERHEPNAIVRRLYQGAIEEEVSFLRLIEATYEGDSERFAQLDQRLNPAPTREEMVDALAGLTQVLAQGLLYPEAAEVSQRVIQHVREQLHLPLDLALNGAEAYALQQGAPVLPAQIGQRVSAQAVKRFFEAILHENGYEGWQVSIDPKASGPRVEAGLRQVFLPESPMSVERIREYLAHELAGHVERAVIGERSGLGLLGIGTSGHLLAEEGLALYRERQALASSGQSFDDSGIWFGVLAVGFAQGVITPPQTFLSLYAFFEPLHLLFRLLKQLDTERDVARERARNAALARCLRTYRGVPDLESKGVCFSKDVVYLRGLRQIERAVAQDESVLKHLAVGKIALEDIPAVQELGIGAPSQSLQELAYQPGLEAYILSFEQVDPAQR